MFFNKPAAKLTPAISKQALVIANQQVISYQLERRTRHTVGLKVTQAGLVVHVPQRLALRDIEAILQTKLAWIIQKLEEKQQNQIPEMQWLNGEPLHLLGHEITLSLRQNNINKAAALQDNCLIVSQPNITDTKLIKRKTIAWYKKEALNDFARRLQIFSTKLNVPVPKLMLSNAKSRWGSCNSRGEVRLNWRLIQAPPSIINYVVCHELAHLKEMNHSARFWAIVEKLDPNYQQAEKDLKKLSPQLHRL